jgi:hypothetical protein
MSTKSVPEAPALRYLDYVAMVTLMDAEASRPKSAAAQKGQAGAPNSDNIPHLASFESAAADMTKAVKNYDDKRAEFAVRASPNDIKNEPFLFNADIWVPFGHADLMSITLSDDIDAVQTVIENYNRTVEEVMVGYCPDPAPYQAAWPGKTIPCPIVAPADIVGKEQHPLLVFSKLRMSPLLSLGRAFINQRLIYGAIMGVMASTLALLRKESSALFDASDLDAFQVSFLDLQGEEEFGLLLYGTNFTVSIAVLTAIQSLTWQSLHETDSVIFSQSLNSRVFREAIEGAGVPGGNDEEKLQAIGGNHIFRWTSSRASVAWSRFRDHSKHETIKGKLSYKVSVGALPGHQRIVEDKILLQPTDPTYRLHTLGSEDIIYSHGGALVDTKAFISNSYAVYQRMHGLQSTTSRHMTLWAATVSIPVPVFAPDTLHPEPDSTRHQGVIHRILSNGRNDIFSIDFLRDRTKKVGLPTAMRRSLVQLYGSLNGILRNHHSFDLVLDYLDVFHSFYDLLTIVLPAGHDKASRRDYQPRASEKVVSAVAVILDSLHDGMKLRLRGAYPETPLRDWSFDFRSSLLQTVLAAEAVLKCSVGILRKDLIGVSDEKTNRESCLARRCLGVALHLGFAQGILVDEINVTKISDAKLSRPDGREIPYRPRLAIFKGDFPHLSYISGYGDFFHEAFHLVLSELQRPGPEFDRVASDQVLQPLISHLKNAGSESANEILTETALRMMELLFVFGMDKDLMVRSHFAKISTMLGKDENSETVAGLSADPLHPTKAKYLRLLASNAFPVLASTYFLQLVRDQHEADAVLETRPFNGRLLPPLRTTVEALLDSLKQNANWLADADEWLFDDSGNWEPAALETLTGAFAQYWVFMVKSPAGELDGGELDGGPLAAMWDCSRALYVAHCRRIGSEHGSNAVDVSFGKLITTGVLDWPEDERGSYLKLQKAVDDLIVKEWAFEWDTVLNGSTTSRIYGPVVGNDPKLGAANGESVDATLLVRRLLYHYQNRMCRVEQPLNDQPAKPSKRVLHRDPNGGAPQFETGAIHAPFLIDRTLVPLFSTAPKHRRHRLGMEIAVLKSLWDIGSRTRGRRFVSLLDLIAAAAKEGPSDSGQASA